MFHGRVLSQERKQVMGKFSLPGMKRF